MGETTNPDSQRPRVPEVAREGGPGERVPGATKASFRVDARGHRFAQLAGSAEIS